MMELNTQRMEDFTGRYKYFLVFMGIAFFLLVVRLWYLQVIRGSELRKLSENNRIRIRENPADRGMVLDRKGRVLAQNRPSFEVYLVPEDLKGNPEVVERVGEILNLVEDEIQEKLNTLKRRAPFKPMKVKADIEWKELALLETNRVHLPGLVVDVRPRRSYNYGDLASHLLGYMGEVDENDLRQARDNRYRMGAFVGKYGVEHRWESDLRGVDGGRQIEVDAMGREIKPLQSVKPIPGSNLYLTIDLDLQRAAEEAFQDKNGALVAMDPQTGRVLAMLSKPSFDPGVFARNISLEEWQSLVENPSHPLQNKVIQGQYPPGSVFKIITAIAGLESGAITPQTQFVCTGAYTYGNRDFRCAKEGGHGTLSLHRALAQSCDVFFYQVGLKTGVDRIAHYAREFGLGRPTGIPLLNEKSGTVPSSAWKKKRFGTPWYSGETLSVAIGQGYINVTPIQLLTLISAVANGGRLYAPQVVEKVENISGFPFKEYPPVESGRIDVSEKTLQIVREGLLGAVNEPGGTGWASALKGVMVAGKTGTAQVVRMEKNFRKGDTMRLPQRLRDHGWFVAFAPYEDPKIAVVVLVEHGGFGGAVAAPIAKKVIEKYLNLQPGSTLQAGEKPRDEDLDYDD
jgi:penicillin-binding protein 2